MALRSISPWLDQVARARLTRKSVSVSANLSSDVAIIGGGIAGLATAFFTLTRTRKRVVLLEAGRLAHGATGHNAGQLASYFEKPFEDIAAEYGLDLAAAAQRDILSAWDLLAEMAKTIRSTQKLLSFEGHAGLSSTEQVESYARDLALQKKAGIEVENLKILNDPKLLAALSPTARRIAKKISRAEIETLLETKDSRYVGVLTSRKGCANGALLCEEIAAYLLAKYPTRFQIFEESPVDSLILNSNSAVAAVRGCAVTVRRAILCTNGFENIRLINAAGQPIDASFHDFVMGSVGSMAAYRTAEKAAPTACSYFVTGGTGFDEEYFYLTRRPDHAGLGSLVCIGGPEQHLPEKSRYSRRGRYSPEALADIQRFVAGHVPDQPGESAWAFRWHGLMGYTKTELRLVGPEPMNPVLLYNLGCNGVGMLPSIFGGNKIARLLAGEVFGPSVFDPPSQEKIRQRK